jgi:hypothetical protein
LFEVFEEAFLVLDEERGWVLGWRDLVFVLEEFGGEPWEVLSEVTAG